MARRQKDKLVVQVALRIKTPPGVEIPATTLQDILDRIVSRKPIPKTVEIRGIYWRNPNRTGRLSQWRYHEGADLTVAPVPRESSPRGSLRDAIDTLADSLSSGIVTF